MSESCSVCGVDIFMDEDGDYYETDGEELHTSERCNEIQANTQPEGM